jgi:hypothetical protein
MVLRTPRFAPGWSFLGEHLTPEAPKSSQLSNNLAMTSPIYRDGRGRFARQLSRGGVVTVAMITASL